MGSMMGGLYYNGLREWGDGVCGIEWRVVGWRALEEQEKGLGEKVSERGVRLARC